MSAALLLVDLQYDFIERPGLLPALEDLSHPIESLLAFAREQDLLVIHIRTRISPSGEDRMPHWKNRDICDCIAGTRGAEPPTQFAALHDEPIVYKQFFSGFSQPQLQATLDASSIDELWVAGLYTHSCVRDTVMDAYERGYQVKLITDCLGSNDPLHARLSLDYMAGRSASLYTSVELMGDKDEVLVHHAPANPAELVAAVHPDSASRISSLIAGADKAATSWRREPLENRRHIIREFRERLATTAPDLVERMISDLGKPRGAALEEMGRAIGHIDEALALELEITISPGVSAIYEPHGVVALITPWNNPVAIAVGKLCAALLLGNSVVWKPAPQAHNISRLLLEQARLAGIPAGLLQTVNGGPTQVIALAQDPRIAAVSITGSERAGRAIAPICLSAGKPLQAELGGNNALLVTADTDIASLAPHWARLAFGFAGQRCTAIRRFVVERAVADTFEAHMCRALEGLAPASPELNSCEVGPLVSAAQLARVEKAVNAALDRGARLVSSGPPDWQARHEAGHYYPPTLLADLVPSDPLVQNELFGPVAAVQQAEDFQHGLELVNGVRQGLLAGIATGSASLYDDFATACEAGIVVDGHGMPIHPAAPFGGRKTSQIGPPEHGIWDRQFFGLVQARYRSTQA